MLCPFETPPLLREYFSKASDGEKGDRAADTCAVLPEYVRKCLILAKFETSPTRALTTASGFLPIPTGVCLSLVGGSASAFEKIRLVPPEDLPQRADDNFAQLGGGVKVRTAASPCGLGETCGNICSPFEASRSTWMFVALAIALGGLSPTEEDELE